MPSAAPVGAHASAAPRTAATAPPVPARPEPGSRESAGSASPTPTPTSHPGGPRRRPAASPPPTASEPEAEPRTGGAPEAEPPAGGTPEADPHPGGTSKTPAPRRTTAEQQATVPPEFDLARSRPGGRVRALLDKARQERSERLGSRLQRRSEQEKRWRTDLAGEKRVGSELHRLRRHGWHVLHSVPLSGTEGTEGTEDIEHLLIGPGGVFTVATRHHPGRAVRIDDETVQIDRGTAEPHGLAQAADAARVHEVLAPHCAFPLRVQAVVVYVGVTELTVEATRLPARLYQERQVSALGPLTGVLDPAQAAHVHRIARDRRTWPGA
ncbi:nuclease-related domain-containing protein [Streptomyces triticagri]|nr:nuclease-related domain-containing protein [Streptomyces triticagri]